MKASSDWIEHALDEALAMTFPASDPVALSIARTYLTTDVSELVAKESFTEDKASIVVSAG